MVRNVKVTETWESLRTDPRAHLVDVRTDAEWTYVGLPDLIEAGKQVALIPWQLYPSMGINGQFVEHLRQAGFTAEDKLFFLCRSGARSLAAAQAAISAGWPESFNVEGGFEGVPNAKGHRGTVDGWKAAGLPWRQR